MGACLTMTRDLTGMISLLATTKTRNLSTNTFAALTVELL
jgi:hypothetical protein